MVKKILKNFLSPLLATDEKLQQIDKLFGEASYREYFRVHTNKHSYILMKMPAGPQSVSEEITNYQGKIQELPFLNVARYLHQAGLPVPEVIATKLDEGLILLQDLGDRSFESLLQDGSQEQIRKLYQQAIQLLLKFQKIGETQASQDCIAFHRSFDASLLNWEFQHFLEYGIEDRFNLKIEAKEKKEMEKSGEKIAQQIASIPYELTHRDFQSRNLMFHQDQFYLIDFQDALLGPPQYDLVALLRDSYVELDFKLVKELLGFYLLEREKIGLPTLDTQSFYHNFHLITLQRKLKDTGRFQFIKTVKKNDKFLPHVPASLSYVRQAFGELPEYQPLQGKLAKYVPELK